MDPTLTAGLIVLLVCLAAAAFTARTAELNGRSPAVYGVFCFFVPPAALILIPYLLIAGRAERRHHPTA